MKTIETSLAAVRCRHLVLWLLLSLAAGFPAIAAEVGKPNLILIFADDLGYGDVGCYGGRLVPTPAIDSLARGGVRCTDGYVTAPVCAPSRCGIMTGAYNQRFGMQWNDDRRKYTVGRHPLLPQTLRAAGYVTGHVGKWNIPVDVRQCFDEVGDLIDWEADYFPKPDGHYVGVDNPAEIGSSKVQGVWGPARPGEEYLTDRLGRHAVEFIEKHKARPFFLYLAFNAVHSPWHAKAADRARFAHLKPHPLDFYAAMIASLDEGAARAGDWKLLIRRWRPKLQLFNLADDIGEKHDLAAEKPEIVERLHGAWMKWSQPLPPRANPQPAKPAKGKPAKAKKAPAAAKPAAPSR